MAKHKSEQAKALKGDEYYANLETKLLEAQQELQVQ